MCLACLEAELWMAYQEDLASKQASPAVASGAAGTDAAATGDALPDHSRGPFVCEEPRAT